MAQTTQQEKATTQRGTSTMDTVKEVAGKVGEAAQGAVSSMSHMASDAASFIGRKADAATSAVGSGMKSVAGTIESGGRYLEEHSLSDMGRDVTELIRRNPIPALLIALGLGFLIARAVRG